MEKDKVVTLKQNKQVPVTETVDAADNMFEDARDSFVFEKFDIVDDFSDHHFAKNATPWTKQPPKEWAKKIQGEWRILQNHLPDTIFVRVYESRMDLLRAAIIGAEGTPYHDGLFFFDVSFPSNYPSVPPLVYYYSRSYRINPNLYNNGTVCLSLLNTWYGRGKELWIPKESTILQVLVSIQGLILNSKPFFNEPGVSYLPFMGKLSKEYNENTFMFSLKTMVCSIKNPPKHFEELVAGHFSRRARDILVACKSYIDGAQVGCLVKGSVQDPKQSNKRCSEYFRKHLAEYITILVEAFREMGVNDCDEFLSLTQNATAAKISAPKKFWFFFYHQFTS
ncbi:OLC1v1006563C1 [Oldenlandia corymbosa var. corymbosa]|uniref:E2 ubiquitin-conjugating enzyme n=1 Tax=Oldenlandia corymbosa var. corymbosa TaxID=529605 RepID=A0AAV1DHB0_OLDCO|nr:OLC1v1006563C1 [Oldenlandia corymbosa var. corymbosa]